VVKIPIAMAHSRDVATVTDLWHMSVKIDRWKDRKVDVVLTQPYVCAAYQND